MNNSLLIELLNVSKIFLTDEIETHALSNINLTINKSEYLSITGPSGCGKSTLLSLLGLLDNISTGEHTLVGTQVSNLSRDKRAVFRNKEIGFIFQSFNLISALTVYENVELPLTYRKDISAKERKAMVESALQKVEMSHRTQHFPSQLSGGQQQRIAIARAIAGNPSIILADEPTGNLDSKNAQIVMSLLDKLNDEGSTICMVTHDHKSAIRANRMIEIYDGKIVSDQSASKVSAIAI